MNTVAHNVVAKLSVAFVAVAMLFTMVSPAKAATAEEMQQMINQLLAQVAQLQGTASTGGASTASICPYTWTRTLTVGATGMDVMKLQQFLNSDADTRVSASGVGSAGMETEYFGPATGAAVSKLQVKYRADILSPAGLVNPTGTFGPATMKKANALCVGGTTVPPVTGGDDTSDDSDDDMSSGDLSGEADYDEGDLKDGDDTDAEEGQEDAAVAEFDVDFTNGDARITRIDVAFTATGEEDAWDTFDEVSLWVDGEEVARESASDKDDYLGDEDDGIIRFSGLDIVAMEDDTLTVVIGVSTNGSIDNLPATWSVDVDSLRFEDADDVSTTLDATDVSVSATTFDIDVQGGDDELNVKSSTTDPDATTIQVDTDDKTDFATIFAFDLDTDDSVNDITVNDLTVAVVTPNDVVNQVVSDIQLLIDGEVYDDVTWSSNGTASATALFDIDGDLTIDAGDKVTVEVQVEFAALTGNYDEGDTIFASTTADVIDAEGADDLDNTSPDQLLGSSVGETHTLRSSGVVLELDSVSETLKVNDDTDLTDDEGVFVVKFDVTAFEDDIYFNKTAASGTTMGTVAANYVVEDANGATVVSGGFSAALTSTADTEGSRFRVSEGETESFTLTVEYDPATGGFYRVQLYSINFATSNADPATQQLALPAEDFETDQISI